MKKKLNKLHKKVIDLQKRIKKRFDKNTDEININLSKLNFKNSDNFWNEWNDFYSEKGLYSEYLDLKKEIEEFKVKIEDRYEPKNEKWNDILVNFEEELHSCKSIIEEYIQLLKEEATEKMVERINCAIKKQKEHDKNIMNMMGIFLTIFSVIGFGVSNITKENANISTVFMIYGVILMTISGLFYLINFDKNFKENFLRILVPLMIGILLVVFAKCVL